MCSNRKITIDDRIKTFKLSAEYKCLLVKIYKKYKTKEIKKEE